MTKEDVIGQVVILDDKYLEGAYKIDENVPIKVARPYLVVELKGKTKSQLFAVPVQTNVSKSLNRDMFEPLPRRLDTQRKCDCGLLFGQMIPITANQVLEKKGADRYVPRDESKREIVIENLWFSGNDNIPEKARASFNYLKKQARGYGLSIFQDKQFQQSYKIVANEIYKKTTDKINKDFELITKKAQNYLENHYLKFLREKVYKRTVDSDVVMPTRFTRIDKLVKFLHEYNAVNNVTVKTSLQEEKQRNPLIEKYKLTDEQFAAAEKVATKDKKDLEKMIRKNIEFAKDGEYDAGVKAQVLAEQAKARAERQKQPAPKTQEKIAPKQPRKNTAQNSR
ncbi:MAG: hypothetical protein NC133_04030 [Prevotella sp.]|nr:hypothetical protein [Prevotella sp.]